MPGGRRTTKRSNRRPQVLGLFHFRQSPSFAARSVLCRRLSGAQRESKFMSELSKPWLVLFAIGLLLLVLATADLFIAVVSVVLLFFGGILFAVFINGLCSRFSRGTKLPYRVAYGIVVFLLAALLLSTFVYMGSSFSQQLGELSGELRNAYDQFSERLREYDWIQRVWPDAGDAENLTSQMSQMFPQLVTALQAVAWGLTGIVVIAFVGLYVAFDPTLYKEGVVKIVPRDRRDRARDIIGKVHSTLGWWLLGRIISMSIVGIFTAVGLWLLGVPMPITLGVLAALLTFIPNIGPILAAVPQALLALQVGPETVLYVIIFNIALQTVESYLVTPIVQHYEVTLPPALTIFAQLVMTVMFGIIGIMLAAPLIAAILVLVQTLYIGDQLGDPEPGRLSESV